MIIANTNYAETLIKVEQLKTLIIEVQQDIYNQIPQGITNHFDDSKTIFISSLDEVEIMLNEFKK